uniref:Uncharacterized protein n=1 Tax=Rhodnius prolixus TaxID=13249 RepID=T1HQE9_RHOPR
MDGRFKLKELKNIGRPLSLDDLKKERSQKILAAIDRKKPLQLIAHIFALEMRPKVLEAFGG